MERKNIDQISKKINCMILKCSPKQGTVLLNFLIILQWYLKQNLKQLKEQDFKY